jgi:hypothetical protein
MVVEKESESAKRKILEEKISQLERILGQKQVEIEYLNRVIIEGEKILECDLKKSTHRSVKLVSIAYKKSLLSAKK